MSDGRFPRSMYGTGPNDPRPRRAPDAKPSVGEKVFTAIGETMLEMGAFYVLQLREKIARLREPTIVVHVGNASETARGKVIEAELLDGQPAASREARERKGGGS